MKISIEFHPDHKDDVLAALRFVQNCAGKYGKKSEAPAPSAVAPPQVVNIPSPPPVAAAPANIPAPPPPVATANIPAPPPAAPVATAVTPAAASLGEEDSAGYLWDGAVHSDSKNTNKGDGRWRMRRGLDKAVKEAWLAAHPAPGAKASAAPVGTEPTSLFGGPEIPAPPMLDFKTLVGVVDKILAIDGVTPSQVKAALRTAGVDIETLNVTPDQWDLAFATLTGTWPEVVG